MIDNKLNYGFNTELCPICTREMGSSVVITGVSTENSTGTKENTLWSKTVCNECREMKSKGFILIGAVESKTTDKSNPYRSGNIWCVKWDVAEGLFQEGAPKSGVAFVDVNVAKEMNLPNVKLDA